MTTAEDILERVKGLSPLPSTLMNLISVLNDPRSGLVDIIEAVRYDQAIVTQMLKVCNSAHFGLSRRVSSLIDATRFLGTTRVLQLLMAVQGNSLLTSGYRGYGLEPGVLWRHSVAVSLASADIGQRVGLDNVNLASTAGLLHDIGKGVLNEYVATEFAEIGHIITEQNISFAEAEKRVLGFSHEEIGAKIAEKWALPEPIVRCIRYHHSPSDVSPPDSLVDVVYLADCVCLLMGIGLGADGLTYRADPTVMQRCGLHESDLEMVGVQVIDELQRVEQAMSQTCGAAQTNGPAANTRSEP